MKTLHLVMTTISLLVCTILANSYFVQAVPFTSFQDRYIISDVVLIGKIISTKENSGTQTLYEVQVEQYLKNPSPEGKIMVLAYGTKGTPLNPHAPYTVYSVGDRVFFYLKGKYSPYDVLWFSYPTSSLCEPAPTEDDVKRLSQLTTASDLQPLYVLHDNKKGPFRTGENLTISYKIWNSYFTTRTVDAVFNVTRLNDSLLVFRDSKSIQLEPCIGYRTVTTDFVPKESGNYNVVASSDRSYTGQIIQVRNNSNLGTRVSPTIILPPLMQFKSGIDPYKTKCKNDLVLVISSDNMPACVKKTSLNRLWFDGWINKSPSIYMKYINQDIAEKFQSKIISREQAIGIAQDYVKQNSLKLNVNMTSSTFKIVTSLNYELVPSSYNYLLDVDPNTGLPTSIMTPWWTDYYTNPQWWSELEKSYLGMENKRIENGALVWHVDYRECLNCIAPYPMFMVDAITGKVILANTGF